MEKDPLLLQDQVGGMDDAIADIWDAMNKIWSLRGQAQVIWFSVLHV